MINNQSVSIIICSKGRSEELRRLVYILQNLPEKEMLSFFEIVVVEEIVSTKEMLEPINGVEYKVVDGSQGFGFMRQNAVMMAKGNIIVFIDDDCIPCSDWLSCLLIPFENNEVVGVGGGFIPQEGNVVAYAISLLELPGGGLKRLINLQGKQEKTRNLSNGSLAILRKSVLDIGGYNIDLHHGGEDSDLISRLDGITIFEPNALVAHRNREGWLEVWLWFFRRGRAVAQCYASQSNSGWSFKRSGIVKVSVIIFSFTVLSLWIAAILCFVYYIYNVFRTYKGNSHRIQSSTVAENARTRALKSGSLFVVPILRLWMDLAFDLGYWNKK